MQQQQQNNSESNHTQQQQQQQQQNHIAQQQQQRYPTYTTTIEGMEDNRAVANNNKRCGYVREGDCDSIQSLGNLSYIMKGSSDHHGKGVNNDDQNQEDGMSTMTDFMNDMSVKDDEFGELKPPDFSFNTSIGTIDNIGTNRNMSGLSMLSMTSSMGMMKDSMDGMLGNNNNSTGREGSQNIPWGSSGRATIFPKGTLPSIRDQILDEVC